MYEDLKVDTHRHTNNMTVHLPEKPGQPQNRYEFVEYHFNMQRENIVEPQSSICMIRVFVTAGWLPHRNIKVKISESWFVMVQCFSNTMTIIDSWTQPGILHGLTL